LVVISASAHAVHHGREVGAAGEQPAGVGVADVVDTDVEVDPGGGDSRQPDTGAEGVAGERGPGAGREQQVVRSKPVGAACAVRLPDGQAARVLVQRNGSWRM
jgi:hypothetical protein